jgi:hypothetical protein
MSRPSAVDADDQHLHEALAWLAGDEARRIAASQLRRLGFASYGVDALISDVAAGAIRRFESDRSELRNPAAYCTTSLRNEVFRLARGRRSRRDASLDELLDERPDDHQVLAQFDDVPEHEPGEDVSDPLRVAIELQVAPVWVQSAALTFVTLAVHESADVADLPSPLSGARSDQALCWPALYLAGHDDLFPADSSDAIRRRRSRYIRQVLDAVNAAFVAAAARGEVQGG